MRSLRIAALFAVAMLAWVNTAAAKEAGDWVVRAGVTHIDPKSNNGSLVVDALEVDSSIRVDSATMMTFDGTYMVTDNFGVEVLAALPFKHDVSVDGLGKVGSVKHLPPTVSGVWNFNPAGKFQPYVGAGVNWTIFFDESEKGVLDDLDASLKLSNSLGLAAVFGVDIMLTDTMFINGNIRYMDIDTDAKIGVPGLGTLKTKVKIDPWVYGINIGWVF